MESEEVFDRINKFLDKEKFELTDKFLLTKRLNEKYWDEIKGEDLNEESEEDNDLFGDLDNADSAEEEAEQEISDEDTDLDDDDDDDDEELPPPPLPPKSISKGKKPKKGKIVKKYTVKKKPKEDEI